jgi:outer membrane protein assembly factor BamB
MNGAARGHGKGPKSTPVVADGRLFTLGITGILSCYHTVTAPQPAADGGHRPPVPNAGDLMWRWSARDRFPVSAPLYGTATSPIVVGDQVIAHLGGAGEGALVARAVADGGERWRWDQDGPGYASPVVVDVDGVPQLVTQTEKLCLAVDPTSGRELWRLPFTTPYDQNIVTPVALGPGLVAFSGLEQGTRAVQLGSPGPDGTPQTLWHNPGDWLYMSSPLVSGTRLFGLTRRDRGRLFCLDTASGEAIWKSPGGQGDNVVFLDLGGALLLLTTEARLIVLDPAAAAFEPLAEYRVADSATWAHPAVTADRLLIKDASHLTSWRLPVADADAPTSVTP